MTSREAAAAGKRERLVAAAVALAYEQGYRRTTLADIAEQSGVPLGNVYYYFRTKDEMMAFALGTEEGRNAVASGVPMMLRPNQMSTPSTEVMNNWPRR